MTDDELSDKVKATEERMRNDGSFQKIDDAAGILKNSILFKASACIIKPWLLSHFFPNLWIAKIPRALQWIHRRLTGNPQFSERSIARLQQEPLHEYQIRPTATQPREKKPEKFPALRLPTDSGVPSEHVAYLPDSYFVKK